MALVISFEQRGVPGRGPLVIVVVLEKENLELMRDGQPYHLHTNTLDDFAGHAIGQLEVIIAYEEDTAAVLAFRDSGDRDGLIAYLERGRPGGTPAAKEKA